MPRTLPLLAALACAAPPLAAQAADPYVAFKVLKPELALQMAEAAMEYCRDEGYQVGVTVVDRFGLPQVFLRDRYAGLHVYETSRRKAWTAASFRTGTTELHEATAPGSISQGIRQLSEALPLGGGVLVEGSGTILGAIGVSGAPSPALDDECAEAGIAAIEDMIAF